MANLGQYNLTSSDGTTAQAGLGDEIDIGGNRFKYLLSSGTIAAYSACTVSNVNVAVEATTTTSGAKPTLFAIPQFDVADAEYFWAPIGPFEEYTPYNVNGAPVTFKVLAATLCATSVKLYTTATDGVVDDSATDLIAGLCLTSTNSTGGTVATGCVAVQRLVSNCQD